MTEHRGASYRKGESPWTEDMIQLVISLWRDGYNKQEIANLMPFDCTREMVVGKIFRMRRKGYRLSPHWANQYTRRAA